MDPAVLGRIAVTFTVLVCSLGVVTWRQSRALEVHRTLDDVRLEVSVAQAERVELERQIEVLRSRARIVPEARALGMHTPDATEQVILVKGDDPADENEEERARAREEGASIRDEGASARDENPSTTDGAW